jgi:HD-GYP domain-containing protein (c-di-GMP phosphodiesterase class II)
MSEPVLFLKSFVQTLATIRLYSPGHPQRSRAVDGSFAQLGKLLEIDPHPRFSFLELSVIYGDSPIHDLPKWPWARRLAAVGVQRMEFDLTVSRAGYEAFVDHVLNLLTTGDEGFRLKGRQTTVKFGQVGIREGDEVVKAEKPDSLKKAYTLDEEMGVVQYLQHRVATGGDIPPDELETVVRSLAVAMRQHDVLMAPLLELKQHENYAAVHALNVAMLVMTFAESLGLSDVDVHAFGIAGLLHDTGMILISPELTLKGSLTPEERGLVESHSEEGARLIIRQNGPDLAATVAYEHHMRPDATGYPAFVYPRDTHFASKIVSVCSAFDALRMARPYRPAWNMHRVLEYIYDGAGTVFDKDIAWHLVGMMQRLEGRIATGRGRVDMQQH